MKTAFHKLGAITTSGLLLFIVHVAAALDRPNVIIINIDNHHKGSLSYFGNTFIETPNIDRLFEQGIRMQNFHTAGRCTSSRSALMTGRYHARNGALGTGGAWGQTVDGVRTIAHVFKEGGYRTGMFGKWHLGDSHGQRPEDRGFDEVCSFENGAYLSGAVARPGYNGTSRTAEAHRFNHNGLYEVYEGFRTDVWFRESIKFIEAQRDGVKPFFVYLATITAHAAHFGPKDLQTYYRRKYERDEFSELRKRFEEERKKKGKKGSGVVSYPYDHAADVANLDRNVGRLMAKLKDLDLLKNTIIVYMSDGSGGGPASTKTNYPLSNNPTTILWPGQTNGRDIESPLVANIDILPTVADICGIKLSDEYQETIDGQSFASILGVKNAADWEKRSYIYDHQSTGDREGIEAQMVIRPFNMTTVTLPNGEAVSWKSGRIRSKGVGPEAIETAKKVYEKWLQRVLKDFPLGAYMHTHTDDKPIFLRSYPIVDGPGGAGLQQYFLLNVTTDGTYELDTNVTDYSGAERSEEKVIPATFTLYRKKVEGHLPVEFDDALNVYRVLPKTLKSAFVEAAKTEVKYPVKLKAGPYLVHIKSSNTKPGQKPKKSKIRVQRRV